MLLINNRSDRAFRTAQMLELAKQLDPAAIWLMGASLALAQRRLRQAGLPEAVIVGSAADAPFESLRGDELVLAIGNIAGEGRALIERIKSEGVLYGN